MSHLVEAYASATRLRIEKMRLFEHFFPLAVEGDYLVFVTSAGAHSRFYSYYREVLWLLKDSLKEAGIKTVQCGLADDPRIGADVDICGQTDFYQFFYVIAGAKLLISGDTSALHVAGHYDVPLVSLFSISDPKNSGAYFGNKEKQIYLKPEFEGYHPSFDPNENPKTIDRILPESIANASGKLLGLDNRKVSTIQLGSKYHLSMIDVIPDHTFPKEVLQGALLNIRFDIGGREDIIFHYLAQRRCNLLTNKPINPNFLNAVKGNIENLIYEINDDYSLNFIEQLQKRGIPYMLMTDWSQEKLNLHKEIFMDYGLVLRRDIKEKLEVENANLIDSKSTKFKSGKFLLSNGRIFMSKAHFKADQSIDSFDNNEGLILDTSEFWREQEFFYIFNDN